MHLKEKDEAGGGGGGGISEVRKVICRGEIQMGNLCDRILIAYGVEEFFEKQ